MHPEGLPTDAAIQEILFWQRRTMQMMYTRIAQAIHAVGGSEHPTDYLMFFCLGKKERASDIPENLTQPRRGDSTLASPHTHTHISNPYLYFMRHSHSQDVSRFQAKLLPPLVSRFLLFEELFRFRFLLAVSMTSIFLSFSQEREPPNCARAAAT